MSKLERGYNAPTENVLNSYRMRLMDGIDPAREYVQRRGLFANDGFGGVDTDELVLLGQKFLKIQNVFEGYDLLAQKPSRNNECWYDLLVIPQHKDGYSALEGAIRTNEPATLEMGLDAGAGSGESSKILAAVCKEVVALDMSRPLLDVAGKKVNKLKYSRGYALRKFTSLEGDMTNLLDGPENTFDIAISHATGAYMDIDEAITYYAGIQHVLKSGGKYYEYQNVTPDIHPKAYQTSPRAILAGRVVSILFAFSYVGQIREYGSFEFDLSRLGFKGSTFKIRKDGLVSNSEHITVLEKI